jgi:hypothetical protein
VVKLLHGITVAVDLQGVRYEKIEFLLVDVPIQLGGRKKLRF